MPIDPSRLPSAPALVRVRRPDGTPRLALWQRGRLRALGTTLDELAALPRAQLETALSHDTPSQEELDPAGLDLLAPVETQEIWAAGVTYRRSREARMEESTQKDIYAQVYEAERPELFFKAPGWRAVPPDGAVGIRSDSTWDVPEPELAVLSNAHGEVIAYTVGNDMSSRSIEGENPLYLPQAKVYDRSCALGPAAVLAWEADPSQARMQLEIHRGGAVLYRGEASLTDLVRTPEALSKVLHGALTLPAGAWLLTGTSIVPEAAYTARDGDEVVIEIDGIGRLHNRVTTVHVSAAQALPVSP
jgi:2-dehydro-3-deoxy-D-arabinonate dehydratase